MPESLFNEVAGIEQIFKNIFLQKISRISGSKARLHKQILILRLKYFHFQERNFKFMWRPPSLTFHFTRQCYVPAQECMWNNLQITMTINDKKCIINMSLFINLELNLHKIHCERL